MKKIICLILALVTAVCATGCGQMDKIADRIESAVENQINSIVDNAISQIGNEINDAIFPDSDDASQTSKDENADSGGETVNSSNDNSNSSFEEGGGHDILDKHGTYTSKEDVSLYIHTYGCLPENFISKSQAQDLGWEGGSLEPYAPGKCIGGSRFGNYEGLLPEKEDRTYTECDIDTLGAKQRGAKRIVFSNDGLIYYTDDHYESFTLLYGEE